MAQKPSHKKVSSEQEQQYIITGSPLKAIQSSRRCTDLPCAIIYVLLCLFMLCLAGYCIDSGFPGRLQRGMDVYGNVCGYGEMKGRDYTYYADPKRSLNLKLCLNGCPVVTAGESLCGYTEEREEDADFECFNTYPSKPFFNKICLPAVHNLRQLVAAWGLLSVSGLIVGGAVVLYFVSVRTPILILGLYHVSVGVSGFLMAALCFLVYEEAQRVQGKICDSFAPVEIEDCGEGDTVDGYRSLCWALLAMLFLTSLAVCLTFSKRRSAVSILFQLAKYSNSVFLLLCGLCALAFGVGVYAFFITALVYQVSCGETTTHSVDLTIYHRETTTWKYDRPERILIFFTVGMALWHFSLVAQCFEYIVASYSAQTFFGSRLTPLARVKLASRHLFRYHFGSVLLAAVLVPVGRACRGLISGLRWACKWIKLEKKMNFCLNLGCYKRFTGLTTSDPIAYIALQGDPFFISAKRSFFLFERHARERLPNGVSSANAVIWLFQLLVILIAPAFVMYWILHETDVFQDSASKDVSSVLAMGLYSLLFSWFGAQVYGSYARGTLHGSTISYLADLESNSGGIRSCDAGLMQFLDESGLSTFKTPRIPAADKAYKVEPIANEQSSSLEMRGEIIAPPPSRGETRKLNPDASQSFAEADQLLPQKGSGV